MKKIGLVLVVLAILALLSSVALANCESENARDCTEANLPVANDLVILTPVCAECGRACGSGHETWYSSSKAKDDLYAQTVDPKDLKKFDPTPPSLKINPPPPLEKQEKETTPLEKFKEKLKKKQRPGTGSIRGEAESNIQLADNCVCAECGRACGSGHAS